MLLSDNIEVRSFSTYISKKYELCKTEFNLSFIGRTYDNIFEPLEIAYYNKDNIFYNKLNNTNTLTNKKNTNKFMKYDI